MFPISERVFARSDFLFYKKSVARSTVPSFLQKVPLRLRCLLVNAPFFTPIGSLPTFCGRALRRWRFILSYSYSAALDPFVRYFLLLRPDRKRHIFCCLFTAEPGRNSRSRPGFFFCLANCDYSRLSILSTFQCRIKVRFSPTYCAKKTTC